MKKYIFRKHRELLEDSIKTQKKFNTIHEMVYYICNVENCKYDEIYFKLYSDTADNRINWPKTYAVVDRKFRLVGWFTEVVYSEKNNSISSNDTINKKVVLLLQILEYLSDLQRIYFYDDEVKYYYISSLCEKVDFLFREECGRLEKNKKENK